MKTEKALNEEYRKIVLEQKEFLKNNYDPVKSEWKNVENEQAFDAYEVDLKKIDTEKERSKAYYERQEQLATSDLIEKDNGTLTLSTEEKQEKYKKSYERFVRYGESRLSPEDRQVLSQGQVRGTTTQTTTDAAGGFMIDEGWTGNLNVAREHVGSVRQAAQQITTSTGNILPWPKVDDTATDAELQTEGSAITVADMTFGNTDLSAYTVGTLVKVSRQLLQDEQVGFQQILGMLLGERIARKENSYLTTGTGSSQPTGVVTAASEGPASGTETTVILAANDIYNLVHSVDPAYRDRPTAGFMLHDGILKELKKLSVGSSDDRPLWVPSLSQGSPATIDGKPYWINQSMAADLTAANKIMLFGDFNQFLIRDVAGISMTRLDERYAEELNVGFIAHQRFDSNLIGPSSAIKYLYVSAT